MDAAFTHSAGQGSERLHVLFQARSDLVSLPGGDTVQVLKTREYLHKLGVTTDFDPDPDADLAPYDLVHLINLTNTKDTYLQALNTKRQGKKVALSTVYWNREELEGPKGSLKPDYREPLRYKVRRLRRHLQVRLNLAGKDDALGYRKKDLYYKLGYHRQVCEIIRSADILLPNSHMEARMIRRDFPVNPEKPVTVVVNGIDPGRFSAGGSPEDNAFERAYGIRDFLLCVGRIEKRKNQVGLMCAVQGLPIPVVCVGGGHDRGYARKVTSLMRSFDRIVESWPHDRIREVYALARLHVLPSYYETPGLASLEAGAAGVHLVVGDRGAEREYFGDRVEYCDPTSIHSVRTAVERALARKMPAHNLAEHIRANFTWETAALQTLQAYGAILPGGGDAR